MPQRKVPAQHTVGRVCESVGGVGRVYEYESVGGVGRVYEYDSVSGWGRLCV